MRPFILLLAVCLLSQNVFAEDQHHQQHDHSAIYLDPLMTEHAFLENKLRFDFGYQNRAEFERQDQPVNADGETTQEGQADILSYGLLFEWILSERIGIGLSTSLLQIESEEFSDTFGFGDTEVEMKFVALHDTEKEFVSTFSFGVGIPTGNEGHGLGEGRVELEPGFLLFKTLGPLVLQGQYAFSIELGSGEDPRFIKYNHSIAMPLEIVEGYHFSPILEVLGNVPLNGESKGQNQLSLMPGFRMELPFDFSWGVGVKFPVGRYAENEAETLITLSKHLG